MVVINSSGMPGSATQIGAKLAALGYEVFADVLRLKGGDDWERVLENAIREKAAKFLLVATPHGVQKQGVRNEHAQQSEPAKTPPQTKCECDPFEAILHPNLCDSAHRRSRCSNGGHLA